MCSLSSSSRNNKSEIGLQGWTYDVVLSYHDKDSGKLFASYLYSALTQAGYSTLISEDHTSCSEVERSRSCIIVFSSNFDASTWFLEQLEKILECHGTTGQVVLPVFYDVDPSDVCQQKGVFAQKSWFNCFNEHKSRRYRAVLSKVANMSGFRVKDSISRDRSKNINDIVQHLIRLIDGRYLSVAEHPVGVEARVQDVIQLLNNGQPEKTIIVGIWGMNGVGKTTIAKATYNEIGFSFEGQSFLENVNDIWKQKDGQVSLQKKLVSDIYTRKQLGDRDAVVFGEMAFYKRFPPKKILLVLDNVSELEQFNALYGSSCEWFGHGSRIIITTRDIHLLHYLPVDHVYKMKYMDIAESLELFSWHAFKFPSPIESYAELCRDVVEYCGGLPLAIKVIGSFLFDRSGVESKFVLEKLKIPTDMIMRKLRTDFDDLDDDEKKIFLDVATLFIGMDRDNLIQSLQYSVEYLEVGITILEQKNLITIDSKNKIGMHSLVRAMGIEIKREHGIAETKMYDVFLSFRGEDSRAKFISHLHSSLQNAGIYVFKDDDGIQRGDQISVSLLQAIGQSRISIVVLSRNYANSKWCMLELERIVEISRTKDMVVVPVFYEVDPSDVRNQTGEFGQKFNSLLSTISVDEYTKQNWKTALHEVGGRAGVVIINSRNESKDVKKIIELVTHLLDKTKLFVADHPVGLESRVKDVIQLLNCKKSNNPLLLGIWGMGGIGKTTLAKAVYNQIRHDFDGKSFLFNVREVWKIDNGNVSLQQRLFSDIYKTTKIKIDTVESGTMILQERLREKKIFLVIDDVNKVDQLNALCGNRKWFGEGSRIIITTRDDDLLSRLEVDHVYRMKEMDENESLELFNWHAFKQPIPGEGFTSLSRDVVKYSGGLPLALQVIGSFLLTKRREAEWNSVLEKLKLIPNDEVSEKLRISFDGLSDDDMKDIFLDIAFFFIGMDQEDVTMILKDCGHFPEIGISVLVQQSLITIDRKNKIGMHDLLRDMGREIIRKKSKVGGKEPIRLWRYEDVHELSKDPISLYVKGLTLKMSRLEAPTCLQTKEFEKMNRLKLLQFAGVQLDGDYKYLSKDLRWLCWHGFPLKHTPKDLHQGSLVALDLQYSNLERVWRKDQLLVKLKILNLSHSHNLRHTPNFSNLPNLEKLILKDCPSLCELPRSIYKLDSVKTLILSGCTKIDKLEEDIEQMKSLTTLVADSTAITRVPFAVKIPPTGSGLLPGDNSPNWLTFCRNGSSVTFEVPQVDGHNLKTIMCIVYSSSANNATTEGFKVALVINYTKNTIQVYKRDGLLATSDEEEWQRVISNIEPGNKIKVIVGFTIEFIVKKTTIYLVYDDQPIDIKTKHCHEPDKNCIVSSGDENHVLEQIVEETHLSSQTTVSVGQQISQVQPLQTSDLPEVVTSFDSCVSRSVKSQTRPFKSEPPITCTYNQEANSIAIPLADLNTPLPLALPWYDTQDVLPETEPQIEISNTQTVASQSLDMGNDIISDTETTITLYVPQPPPLAFQDLEEFHSKFIKRAKDLQEQSLVSVDPEDIKSKWDDLLAWVSEWMMKTRDAGIICAKENFRLAVASLFEWFYHVAEAMKIAVQKNNLRMLPAPGPKTLVEVVLASMPLLENIGPIMIDRIEVPQITIEEHLPPMPLLENIGPIMINGIEVPQMTIEEHLPPAAQLKYQFDQFSSSISQTLDSLRVQNEQIAAHQQKLEEKIDVQAQKLDSLTTLLQQLVPRNP
ncbi:disease resistance protein (TIR-NBS-LRR class) [Trifolium pratense]|uniref:Disease resistance protein (TIR-NBS-LRR class) n=1 Tax=Trifolium pratense TaxID=57577 RepID=A0A2K3NW26_TRIPR|nr:disease resistance protein (TIR-NBS-LRR class) [Trifolium pratense]